MKMDPEGYSGTPTVSASQPAPDRRTILEHSDSDSDDLMINADIARTFSDALMIRCSRQLARTNGGGHAVTAQCQAAHVP